MDMTIVEPSNFVANALCDSTNIHLTMEAYLYALFYSKNACLSNEKATSTFYVKVAFIISLFQNNYQNI